MDLNRNIYEVLLGLQAAATRAPDLPETHKKVIDEIVPVCITLYEKICELEIQVEKSADALITLADFANRHMEMTHPGPSPN